MPQPSLELHSIANFTKGPEVYFQIATQALIQMESEHRALNHMF